MRNPLTSQASNRNHPLHPDRMMQTTDSVTFRYSQLRHRLKYTSDAGLDLMTKLLCYNPASRLTAEEALKHPWFE